MNTIQLDKPLTEQDLENLRNTAKKDLSEAYRTYRKIGAIVIIASFVWYFFSKHVIHADSRSANDFFFLLSIIGWALGFCIFIMPQLLGITHFENIFYSNYLPAPSMKIHNCKAYINMPGMEACKEYFEKVQSQGRQITNQEADFIIKHWNLLLKE